MSEAVQAGQLVGVWRLRAVSVRMEDTGEVAHPFGADPVGYAVYEPGGRMMIILTASGRSSVADDAGAAALFRGMTAYTGRYRIEGDRIVFAVDVAWDPALEGTEVVRFIDLRGDNLTLTTAVEDHPLYPGRKFRASIAWKRDETGKQ
jgi:Lipocalin-like domain